MQSILEKQTEGRGSWPAGPPHKVWKPLSEPKGQDQARAAPPSQRPPPGGCALEGKPAQVSAHSRCQLLIRPPRHRPLAPEGEATPTQQSRRGPGPDTRRGEKGHFRPCQGKPGHRRAHPSTALKEGAKVKTWPDLGHLPLCLVYQAHGRD